MHPNVLLWEERSMERRDKERGKEGGKEVGTTAAV
jgi:hypothetical protein